MRRTVQEAARRGRHAVRVVHGASTSDPHTQNRTIQHALHALLDARGLGGVTDSVRLDGSTVLGLPVATGRPDPSPLRLADVV